MKTYLVSFISFILSSLTFQSCVQEIHKKTVTFRVAMNPAENTGQIGLRGSFTSPPWEVTLPMIDEDMDGTYETTLSQKTAQNEIQFKFIQNGQYELEGHDNRVIVFEYKPEDILYTAIFDDPDGEQR